MTIFHMKCERANASAIKTHAYRGGKSSGSPTIKRTMQLADVLYGVTMQEPGVSRLVSVKMNAALEKRSQPPIDAVA